ncbi:MAG: SMC-Scp complex subunit ScpB [Phycisphaerae bacterium]|nr:SMC-Scp complex subunit ScpB [Phycisphaerae bacterium]
MSTISVVEAVLFAADEPVTAGKLSEIVGAGGSRETKKHIQALNTKYQEMDCAFRIESIAGGYQLLTQSKFNPWLSKLIKVRSESKLTPAAMETLAIIAYKQPILRVDIENVRGVAAGEMVRQLIEKGVVKIVGRAEELGRPLLYGTTKKFLEVFGLGSLKDLPTLEDAKKRD